MQTIKGWPLLGQTYVFYPADVNVPDMTIYNNKVQILKPSAFDDVELTAGERANAAIFEAEYAEYQAKGGNA